jgi:hypothetical protein
MARSKYSFPILLISAWTIFGIFFGTQNYVRDIYAGKGAALSGYLISWLLCGIMNETNLWVTLSFLQFR